MKRGSWANALRAYYSSGQSQLSYHRSQHHEPATRHYAVASDIYYISILTLKKPREKSKDGATSPKSEKRQGHAIKDVNRRDGELHLLFSPRICVHLDLKHGLLPPPKT